LGQIVRGGSRVNILWEEDYPHAGTPWPHTQAAVKELMADVPDTEMRMITYQNAEKLFDFTPGLPDGYAFD
jgi:hypothetical protein